MHLKPFRPLVAALGAISLTAATTPALALFQRVRGADPSRHEDRHAPMVDVALLVELGGSAAQVENRMGLIRRVAEALDSGTSSESVQVTTYGYYDHGFSRTDITKPVVVGFDWQPIGTAREALAFPGKWSPTPVSYTHAAPVEDALYELSSHNGLWRAGARHVLIVVGLRPPHPYPQEASAVYPCPFKRDWHSLLKSLRQEHSVENVAVIGDYPPSGEDYVQRAWSELGKNGKFNIETTSPEDLLRALGLGLGSMPRALDV